MGRRGEGEWIREATRKERAPWCHGGRPARSRGEAARVNCRQRGKGAGRWAEAFKQELGSGKQPLTFRAGTA